MEKGYWKCSNYKCQCCIVTINRCGFSITDVVDWLNQEYQERAVGKRFLTIYSQKISVSKTAITLLKRLVGCLRTVFNPNITPFSLIVQASPFCKSQKFWLATAPTILLPTMKYTEDKNPF